MEEFVTRREFDKLREADQRALSIKETADLAALGLAREHQRYRDEQANNLREQIAAERGRYVVRNEMDAAVAKLEAELKPVLTFMAAQQGRKEGITALQVTLMGLVGLVIAALSVALAFYVGTR